MTDRGRWGAPTFISLLRGINVGGRKKIRMEDLRALYASLGFSPVRSYIQSGNVVFGGATGGGAIVAGKIEEALAANFGFDVPVILRTAAEMEDVARGNPFLGEGVDPSKLHVTFLKGAASDQARGDFAAHRVGSDELRLVGREAYLHCPGGMARTKLTPTFLERVLGSASTTRNWRTVNAVLEMARSI